MEKIENSIVSFVQAVKGTCMGTTIFQKLKNQSVLRSLWHLFLLAGLCSLMIVVVGKNTLLNDINPKIAIFEEYTGGFEVKKDGVFPKKNADKTFSFLISDNNKVIYNPKFKDIDFNEILDNGLTSFWVPEGVFVIGKFAKSTKSRIAFLGFNSMSEMNFGSVKVVESNKELDEYMHEHMDDLDDYDYSKFPQLTPTDMRSTYLGAIFFGFWAQYFWQLLLVSIVFAVFYLIAGITRRSNMSFKEFFVIGIYAGFPAILISWIFVALDLPFLRYDTVFSFGWLIYLLIVLNSLLKNNENK